MLIRGALLAFVATGPLVSVIWSMCVCFFLAKVNFVIFCKTKFFLSGTCFQQLHWASCLLFAAPRAGNPSYVDSVTWRGRRLSYSSFIWRRGDIKIRRMPCMTEFEEECFYKLSGNRSKVVAKGHRWNTDMDTLVR